MLRTSLFALTALTIPSVAGAAIYYNPVVTMIGDGTAAASGTSRTVTNQVWANTTAGQTIPLSSLAYNSGGSGTRLTLTTSSTSEGMLTNNPAIANNAAQGLPSTSGYVFSAGYDAATATASVVTSATNANRAVGYQSVSGAGLSGATTPITQTQASAYNNNTFRGAVGDDTPTDIWTAGTGTTASTAGWRYFNSNVQVTTTNSTNVRTVEILNGQLFGSTGAGAATGIYAIGTGTPTGSGNTSTLLFGVTSPYEFVLLDDPTVSVTTSFGFDTAFVADDSSGANGGIRKYTFNGTAWAFAYVLNNSQTSGSTFSARGLAGQYDTDLGRTVLWATSADGTKLYQVTDNGSNASSSFITLTTAATNNVFRGVALAVPEPASLALIGLGGIGLLRRRR